MKITGTIESIIRKESGFQKTMVQLRPNRRELLFVEFWGRMSDSIDSFEVNDEVEVKVEFFGSISKKNGTEYNNITATEIKKI